MLSYASLAYISSKSLLASIIIGSAAAAVKCEKEGNDPITKKEVQKKLYDIKKMCN